MAPQIKELKANYDHSEIIIAIACRAVSREPLTNAYDTTEKLWADGRIDDQDTVSSAATKVQYAAKKQE